MNRQDVLSAIDHVRKGDLTNFLFEQQHAQALDQPSTDQEQVYTAVMRRGYVSPYTNNQFIFRNIMKLAEELGELAAATHPTGNKSMPLNLISARLALVAAGAKAKVVFDSKAAYMTAAMEEQFEYDIEELQRELADVQVVVFCIAQALCEAELERNPRLRDSHFNVIEAAKAKAGADIERGVR